MNGDAVADAAQAKASCDGMGWLKERVAAEMKMMRM